MRLWLNLLPFALSLLLRTAMWYLRIPFGRVWHRQRSALQACAWKDGEFSESGSSSRRPPGASLEDVAWRGVQAVLQRDANTLPHTHGAAQP